MTRSDRTRRLTTFALLASLAMILSFIESRIPAFVAIPGVKVGLANIAVLFALYRLGIKEAIIVSVIRIIAISMLFGTPMSAIYSLGGALVSFTVMILLKRLTPASEVSVSVAGAVGHNIGQIAVCALVVSNAQVFRYLSVLGIISAISGTITGYISKLLILYLNSKNIGMER